MSTAQTIKVWDPLVRIVHWSLALLIFNNFLNEEGHRLHRYSGYAALILIVTRLLWGFVGTHHARFSSWFPTPKRVIAYVRSVREGREERHVGHNPAGSVMMITLWVLVMSMVGTGWLLTTDTYEGTGWLENVHAAIAYSMLGCIGLHVAAAIHHSRKHGENIIASMLHGRKRVNN